MIQKKKPTTRLFLPFLSSVLLVSSLLNTTLVAAKSDTIIVAGGCFWCVESDFEQLDGVEGAISGYINGNTENPTYREVASKRTGHYEAVEIRFDPEKISAQELIDFFWKTIDPTNPNGQFCDYGSPYKTALFYQNDQQKELFEGSLKSVSKSKPFKEPIVTEILSAKTFYPAEDYHQDYYVKNPIRYTLYRKSCGRDKRIKELWGEVVSKH